MELDSFLHLKKRESKFLESLNIFLQPFRFFRFLFVIISIEVPYGAPNRAIESLPKEVVLRESKIPNAGFGVVSLTFIKR